MTPLKRTFDIEAVLRRTGLKFNVDYVSCIDSTLLRVYYLKPDARPVLEAALADANCPGHWLSPDEEKRNGIYLQIYIFFPKPPHFFLSFFLVAEKIMYICSG